MGPPVVFLGEDLLQVYYVFHEILAHLLSLDLTQLDASNWNFLFLFDVAHYLE